MSGLGCCVEIVDAEVAAEFEQNIWQTYDRIARTAITPLWVRYDDGRSGQLRAIRRRVVDEVPVAARAVGLDR